MTDLLIGISILLPFASGLLCFLIRKDRIRARVVVATGAVLVITSLMLFRNGPCSCTPGTLLGIDADLLVTIADFVLLFTILGYAFRLGSPLLVLLSLLQILPLAYFELKVVPHAGVTPALYIDNLAIIMNLIISIIGSLICIFAVRYMAEREHHLHLKKSRQPGFFLTMLVFLGAMNGLVFANNLLWLYFFWEITTFCSFMLIRHDRTAIATRNAVKALWMNMLGGVAFVAAIIVLYYQSGSMEFLSLQSLIHHQPDMTAVLLPCFALLCFAGFTKAAQMPFQGWLCGAMIAPSPVSALLHSSTMVKAGVYLVVRLAPGFQGTYLSTTIATFGAFTFLTAAALAVNMSNGKKILAYSTISNLGLIIACAGINTPAAIIAAVLLIIFHALAKGLLFLCVGTIEHAIGSRDIEDMRGLYNTMPTLSRITIIGILTMMLPPFGALMSKWMAIEASAHLPWIVAMVALGSGLSVLFWARWAGIFVSGPYLKPLDPDRKTGIHAILATISQGFSSQAKWNVSLAIKCPLVVLAAASVLLSLGAPWLYTILVDPVLASYRPGLFIEPFTTGPFGLTSGTGAFYILPIFVVSTIGYGIAVLAAKQKRHRVVSAPYMCGEQHADPAQPRFRGHLNIWQDYVAANSYLHDILAENRITPWINIFALALLAVLFGEVLL